MPQALVQISDVMTLLPGNQSAADQAALTLLAGGISEFVRAFTGRDFWTNTYTERYRGNHSDHIPLRQRPVQSIASVYDGLCTLAPAPVDSNGNPLLSGGGYWNDDRALYRGNGFTFSGASYPNVIVTYVAGYAVERDYPSLPQDLYSAMCLETATQFRSLSRIGIKVEGQQGQSSTFTDSNISPMSKQIFKAYQRTWFSS